MYFCNFFSFLPVFTVFSPFIAYFFIFAFILLNFFTLPFDFFEIFFHTNLQKTDKVLAIFNHQNLVRFSLIFIF